MFEESSRSLNSHRMSDTASHADSVASTHENLFSPHVPVTEDDRFVEQFGSDPSVPLPDEILDQRWWKKTGRYLYKQALLQAEIEYYKKLKEHEALLDSVKGENKRIDIENERLREEYKESRELRRMWRSYDLQSQRRQAAAVQQWEQKKTLELYYERISSALLWKIHKRSFFSPAGLLLLGLATVAGIAHVCLFFAMAHYCAVAHFPWDHFQWARIVGCQWCCLLCLSIHYVVYRYRWTRFLESEVTSANLVTQLPEWHRMLDNSDWEQIKLFLGPGKLGTQFVPKVTRRRKVHKSVIAAFEELVGPEVIVFIYLSLFPIFSLSSLFSLFALIFCACFQSEEMFLKQFEISPKFVAGDKPKIDPISPQREVPLFQHPHKPLPQQQPPSFVPPPKPTRPKEKHRV